MRRILGMLGTLAITSAAVLGQAAPQIDKDGIYTSGKGLTPAKLTQAVAAVYPKDPSFAGIKHISVLQVVVGVDGLPTSIRLVNQHAAPFDAAAIAAVNQFRFEPAIYRGSPVPTYRLLWIPFNFGSEPALPIEVSPKGRDQSPPAPLNSILAEYPKDAPKAGLQGAVLVHVLVTEEGLPADIRVVRSLGEGFDENALKAVAKYRFKPATLRGVPVPIFINVEVNFRLLPGAYGDLLRKPNL